MPKVRKLTGSLPFESLAERQITGSEMVPQAVTGASPLLFPSVSSQQVGVWAGNLQGHRGCSVQGQRHRMCRAVVKASDWESDRLGLESCLLGHLLTGWPGQISLSL